jgi:hypothetical protein
MIVTDQLTLEAWRSPETYVLENILEIIKDSFRLDDQSASDLLAQVWPGRSRK